MREVKYILSSIAAIFNQIVIIICGIILPRILLTCFGSEVYGATTSIAQFLSYIALAEGGIAGVARATLYKPLAEKNEYEVSKIVRYIQYFFKMVALGFSVYVLIIACTYKYIANNNSFDWIFTFILVIVISLSSFAQYYFGLAYVVLLQSDQKKYISDTMNAITMIINTIFSSVLALNGINIIIVKLSWCLVHFIRIAILNIYI